MALDGRTVLLGVGGGIAAYKVCEVVRLLVKAGAQVHVAMTAAAQKFVSPLTLQALSRNAVATELLDPGQERALGHIALADAAEVMLVAPATADLLARLAHGLADDVVTTAALATRAPLILAPAMNEQMWRHPATQVSVATLLSRGARIVGPNVGEMAEAGHAGPGRLADPEEIAAAVEAELAPRDLAGKRLLVTAGPTREYFDPVRFLSNPSSGKMGYAIAEAARNRGADVVLVSGPTHLASPRGVQTTQVISAEEMAAAVDGALPAAAVIMAAAVCDWRPAARAPHKVKKTPAAEPLAMVRTPDILADLGARFDGQPDRPVLVGFAAETEKLVEHAREKLTRKKCDLIVANDVSAPDAGFAHETNSVLVVDARGEAAVSGTKRQVADRILDRVAALLPR